MREFIFTLYGNGYARPLEVFAYTAADALTMAKVEIEWINGRMGKKDAFHITNMKCKPAKEITL